MNYSPRITLAVLAVASSILFSSCIKEYEFVKQHPGAEVTGCRINMIISKWEGAHPRSDTFRVHYNAAGDPAEVVATPGAQYWEGDYHFRYDKYHRLTDYFLGNPSYSDYRLIWHRYTYIGKSLVSDSQFNYIEHGGGPNPPLETFAYKYIDSLDKEGRITKVTEYIVPDLPPTTWDIKYNAQGNMLAPGAIYDNKLNINHTSKVWMFITRDFSVNNRLNADVYLPPIKINSYNAAGLPLTFQTDNTSYPYFYLGVLLGLLGYNNLQVVYDCDLNNISQ
jgi:hypothetical protein